MTKKQVKAARLTNEPVLFNKEAALLAYKSAVVKKGGSRGAASELTKGILECFNVAKENGVKELHVSQIREMYNAAKKTSLDAKLFADRVWTLSDRNKKNKAPVLKAGKESGTYTLA